MHPIILDTQYEYAVFKDFGGFLSILPPCRYRDTEHLLQALEAEVIAPALNKAEEMSDRLRAFEAALAKGQG